jgi:hypothetical protein
VTSYPAPTPDANENGPLVQMGYRFAAIPEWILYHPNLSATAVRLYGALARHGMTPDSCYPSHARLAKLIGVSERSIQAPIRDLEKVGAIQRFKRGGDDGERQTSNGYRLAGDTALRNVPPALRNAPPPAQRNAPPPALRNAPKESKEEREQEEREKPPRAAPSDNLQLWSAPDAAPAVRGEATPAEMAKILTDGWYQGHDRPQQRYVAVLKIVTKALKDGWDERDLAQALAEMPTVSGGSLDYWRNRRTRPNGHRPAWVSDKTGQQLQTEAIDRINQLMGTA